MRTGFVVAAALVLTSCAHPAKKTSVRQPGTLPPTMYRQVLNAIDAGDGDFEVRSLRAEVAANPDRLQARLALAARYAALGFPELAVEHSRLAAERFPASPEAYISLAKNLRKMGLTAQAAAELEKFLAAGRSGTAELYSWLGILKDELKDYEAGEKAHRRAVEMAPDKDAMHNNLGFNLLLQGRREEAAAEFRKALSLNPRSEIARNNLGSAIADNPSEAIRTWELATDPATAHSNLAAVFLEQGRTREARRELEIALGYKRDHPAALKNLSLLAEQGSAIQIPLEQPRKGFWGRVGNVLTTAFLGWESSAAMKPNVSAPR